MVQKLYYQIHPDLNALKSQIQEAAKPLLTHPHIKSHLADDWGELHPKEDRATHVRILPSSSTFPEIGLPSPAATVHVDPYYLQDEGIKDLPFHIREQIANHAFNNLFKRTFYAPFSMDFRERNPYQNTVSSQDAYGPVALAHLYAGYKHKFLPKELHDPKAFAAARQGVLEYNNKVKNSFFKDFNNFLQNNLRRDIVGEANGIPYNSRHDLLQAMVSSGFPFPPADSLAEVLKTINKVVPKKIPLDDVISSRSLAFNKLLQEPMLKDLWKNSLGKYFSKDIPGLYRAKDFMLRYPSFRSEYTHDFLQGLGDKDMLQKQPATQLNDVLKYLDQMHKHARLA